MTKKQKKMRCRIVLTFFVFIVLLVLDAKGVFEKFPNSFTVFLVYLIPYGIIGYDIIGKAARNIRNGQIFDENFLMMLATFGAFGVKEYTEAVAVMLFYQVGELFQSYAVGKSRQSISDMMDICPEYANLCQDGKVETVDPDDVPVGSFILVKPGERVPIDGIVTEGESFIDTAALTGESVPRKVRVGSEIFSGCVNQDGVLTIQTTKEFDDSTVSKILEMVENASTKKAKVENFITKFAKYYTPVVTIGAVLLAVIPSIFLGNFGEWITRACIFLVISCPCALVISVPMGFFSGIGAASKKGILVKGSNYLEAVAKMKTIVFDKTGTLTKGEFKVTSVSPVSKTADELLELAALGEMYSNHPIALSIKDAYKGRCDVSRLGEMKEISGNGISTTVDGKQLLLGNASLMKNEGINFVSCEEMGTAIYIVYDGDFMGSILISDTIKDGAKESIKKMRRLGVESFVMLTGDRENVAQKVARSIGIDKVFAELLPGEKVQKVEEMLSKQKEKEYLAFAGDGINDAPVLTRADIGIAMGSMGSDAAIEAADIVLMDDDIGKISTLVNISRKTLRIVKQNIVFALGIKFAVLVLGAFGMANMWEAVFADVGVSVIAIMNSMRALKVNE